MDSLGSPFRSTHLPDIGTSCPGMVPRTRNVNLIGWDLRNEFAAASCRNDLGSLVLLRFPTLWLSIRAMPLSRGQSCYRVWASCTRWDYITSFTIYAYEHT